MRCYPVVEHGAERDALGEELAEAADGADACEELFVAQVLGSEGAVAPRRMIASSSSWVSSWTAS